MRNRTKIELYELVNCMSRSEKRIFSMRADGKKMLQLFNAVKENRPFADKQIHNLKAELYKQVLGCIKGNDVIKQLHDGIEQATLLYDKKLYRQSFKVMSKVKMLAVFYQQFSFQFQVLALEKKIRAMHVIPVTEKDIIRLRQESKQITNELSSISHYSTQSLLMSDYYSRWGSMRSFPNINCTVPVYGFYSKMYKLQCLLYAVLSVEGDDRKCASELCEHFESFPHIKLLEQIQYEKAKDFLYTPIAVPDTSLIDNPVIIAAYFNYADCLYKEKKYDEALDYLIPIINTRLFFRIDLQIKARELHIECHKALKNDEIIDSLQNSLKRFKNKKYNIN